MQFQAIVQLATLILLYIGFPEVRPFVWQAFYKPISFSEPKALNFQLNSVFTKRKSQIRTKK